MKLVLLAALVLSGQAFAAGEITNIVPAKQIEGTFEASLDTEAFLKSIREIGQSDARPGNPLPPPPGRPGRPLPPPPYPGNPGYPGQSCSLLSPGVRDNAGRYCASGHGVLWNGYVLDNTCYFNIDAAFNAMRSARVCNESSYYGACEIVQPMVRDQGQRYCNNAYGVSYYGYIVDNTCFQSADSALSKMHSTQACYQNPSVGRCTIMQHGQRDRNGRYCNNAYGVAYDGVITDNTCYMSLDTAMNVMNQAQYCRW